MKPLAAAELLLDVTIECPAGQTGRYELDPGSGKFELAYNLAKPLPGHYGWIDNSLGADGEALDILVLPEHNGVDPGDHLQVRPIGILLRQDQDHKILAVIPNSKRWGEIYDLNLITPEYKQEIETYLKTFAPLAGWGGPVEAWSVISQCFYRYFQHRVNWAGPFTVEERKLTKDNFITKRSLLGAGTTYLVTERTLQLERDYYIEDKPVWVNGYRIRRWDFPGKWFNLCQVIGHDWETVGYYQDVQYPVLVTPTGLRTVDLILDLWVWPDLTTKVLDADEWECIKNRGFLPDPFLSHCWTTLDTIRTLWTEGWFQPYLAEKLR